MARLVAAAEGALVAADLADLDDLGLEVAIEATLERRDLAAVGIGARRAGALSALAMFSEITRIRPDWAFSPETATWIDLRKSIRASFSRACRALS